MSGEILTTASWPYLLNSGLLTLAWLRILSLSKAIDKHRKEDHKDDHFHPKL